MNRTVALCSVVLLLLAPACRGARTTNAAPPPDDAGITDDIPDASETPAELDAAIAPVDMAAPNRCTTAVFCDDFESGPSLRKVWSVDGYGGGSVRVQSTVVHRGTNAMQIHFEGGKGGIEWALEQASFPSLAKSLFARVYVYVTPSVPVGHAHLPVFAFADGKALETTLGPAFSLLYGADEIFGQGPDVNATAGQWMCVEWSLQPDASAPGKTSGALYVGGALARTIEIPSSDVTGFKLQYAPPLQCGQSGCTNDPTTYDVYYDDLILDTTRIGCAD